MGQIIEPGAKMGDYCLLDVLGEGNSGITYRAKALDGTIVALKILALRGIENWKLVELFEREAQILRSLEHPAIPAYLADFTVDTADDRYFCIAQTLAPGQSIADWITQGWRPTEAEVRDLAQQLLQILRYLQSHNPPVIHRDIKPQNIVRRSDGQIALVDFGAVGQTYHNTLMRGSTVVGTFGYMAPEQFRSQAYPATDLYGLGATLLFVLTRRSPADLPMAHGRWQLPNQLAISEDLQLWLAQLIEPDLRLRWPSAAAALAEFPSGKLSRWIKPPTAQGRVALAAIAMIGLLAGVGGVWKSHYALLTLFGQSQRLHQALATGQIKLADYLSRGGNWVLQPSDRAELLSVAIVQEEYATAEQWLQAQPTAVIRDPMLLTKVLQSSQTPLRGLQLLHKYVPQTRWDVRDAQGTHPLVLARDESVALFLLDRGVNPDVRDATGKPFLQIAAERSWAKVVDRSFKQLGKLPAPAKGQPGILSALALQGNQPSLQQLVELGQRCTIAELKQISFFQLSLKKLQTNETNWFIKALPHPNVTDQHGQPILHHAASAQATQAVQQLITAKVNLRSRDRQDETALEEWRSHATNQRDPAIAKLLIAAEPDVNAVIDDRPLLRWVVAEDDVAFLQTFLSRGGVQGLSEALWSARSPAMLTRLLQAGAKVDAVNAQGQTRLHTIAQFDDPTPEMQQIAAALITAGSDVNARDMDNQTPLDHLNASLNDIQKKETVNYRKFGYIPPHMIERRQNVEALRSRLLQHGAKRAKDSLSKQLEN
jgi:serine/threonine protein kinase/ankyrin repeat protein